MPMVEGRTPWSNAPWFIIGLGHPDDPIPLLPPPNYDGEAAIFHAKSKRAMKEIPDWELLVYFLRGPDLVFHAMDRTWHRERWDRLVKLRKAARKAAKDGNAKLLARYTGAVRFRWRCLVQRSIGYRVMGGKVHQWR